MEKIKNIMGVILFYAILVLGIIAVNYRYGQLEQQKSTNEVPVQIVQVRD